MKYACLLFLRPDNRRRRQPGLIPNLVQADLGLFSHSWSWAETMDCSRINTPLFWLQKGKVSACLCVRPKPAWSPPWIADEVKPIRYEISCSYGQP